MYVDLIHQRYRQTDRRPDGRTDDVRSLDRALHRAVKGHTYHDALYLRNDAVLKVEKLPILAAPLRFFASYALNPRENSYKPLLLMQKLQFIDHIFVADI